MTQYVAAGLLALLVIAGIVIVALLYTDRLPFPKHPPERELTEFERASQELANSFNEVQREIGKALEPGLRRMIDGLNELHRSLGGKK